MLNMSLIVLITSCVNSINNIEIMHYHDDLQFKTITCSESEMKELAKFLDDIEAYYETHYDVDKLENVYQLQSLVEYLIDMRYKKYSYNDIEYKFMIISALITELCIKNTISIDDYSLLDEYMLDICKFNALKQCKAYTYELLSCYSDKYDNKTVYELTTYFNEYE